MPSLSLIFVTMMRAAHARRFVDSFQFHHPDIPIIAAEQAEGLGELGDLEPKGVRRLVVPFDTGLAASRNCLIDALDSEYFLLADDDYFVTESLPLREALGFMEANPEVVFLGGHITDVVYLPDGSVRHQDNRRDCNLAFDSNGGGVVLLPREIVGGEAFWYQGECFEQCDYVGNWGIGRGEFFKKRGFRWEPDIKIGIEHLDFFVRLKLHHPEAKVAFWRKLRVEHHRYRERNVEYDSYRRRAEFVHQHPGRSGLRYQCNAVLGRVNFFAEHPKQVLFSHPDRLRFLKERDRYSRLRIRYDDLKEQLVDFKNRYTDLRSKYSKLQNAYRECRKSAISLREKVAKFSTRS